MNGLILTPMHPLTSETTGIYAEIYRHHTASEMNLLHAVRSVVIVGPNIRGTAVPSERSPAVSVGEVKFNGQTFTHLRPVAHETKWLMFGGDFAYSNQPEYQEVFGEKHLKIHDRYEG